MQQIVGLAVRESRTSFHLLPLLERPPLSVFPLNAPAGAAVQQQVDASVRQHRARLASPPLPLYAVVGAKAIQSHDRTQTSALKLGCNGQHIMDTRHQRRQNHIGVEHHTHSAAHDLGRALWVVAFLGLVAGASYAAAGSLTASDASAGSLAHATACAMSSAVKANSANLARTAPSRRMRTGVKINCPSRASTSKSSVALTACTKPWAG